MARGSGAALHAWALAGVTALALLPLARFGEKIGVNAGLGMDGALFGWMARDIGAALGGLSLYRLQRLLPVAIVHYAHAALGLPVTDASIVRGFALLDALAVIAGMLLWARIAARLELRASGLWLGAVGLTANFAILKMLSYYPVMVDGMAFACGLFALWSWLEGRSLALAALTVASGFVWQTAWPFCLPLLVFPVRVPPQGPAASDRSAATRLAVAGSLAGLAVGLIDTGPWLMATGPLGKLGFAASVLIAGAWLFYGLRPLAQAVDLELLPAALRRNANGLALAAVASGLILAAWSFVPTAPNEYPLGIPDLATRLVSRAFWHPAGFAVAHVLYFGPIVALALWRWPAVAAAAGGYGPALPALLALVVLTSLNSESRHHIFVFPFVVALTAKVTDADGLTWSRVAVFAAISLVASRCWLALGPIPARGYWMNFGPWWSWPIYRTNLAIVAAATAAALLALRRGAALKTPAGP